MPDVQRLLALANGAALHKALRDAGYPAKYRTVARWVQTRQVPPDMEQAVLEAFGLGHQETAPAWWAEAAEQLVDQIEERMMPATSGLVAPEQAVEIVTRAVERLGLPQQPPAEDPAAESAEPRDAADRAAKRQP